MKYSDMNAAFFFVSFRFSEFIIWQMSDYHLNKIVTKIILK